MTDKLYSFGRHDNHDEIVKTDFHTIPNKGEKYDEYGLWIWLTPNGKKIYTLIFDIKLTCATPQINVAITCTYPFKLVVNKEPFLNPIMDEEMVDYLISPYLMAINYMIDYYNKHGKTNALTKDLEYPMQFVNEDHKRTLRNAKIGQKANLN